MIDDHVHPFALEQVTFEPADQCLDVEVAGTDRRADGPYRLNVELLTTRLASLLGCHADEVPAAREEASTDWAEWNRRLLDDADVEGLVMDHGWSHGEPVAPYAELAGRPVWELQRLEPVIDAALESGADAEQVLDVLDAAMAEAGRRGAAGFKSAIAYRTGLAVQPTGATEQAQRALRNADLPGSQRTKPVRDLAMRRALANCADLGLPLQVHTGFGSSDVRPPVCDPLLLDPLLRTPEGQAARVVLIHGGWPWHDEVGYLASVHRNVWAELSLVQLFAPAATADRLLRLVEVAPTNRVLLGSDGHETVESIWFGGVLLRNAWHRARASLASAGAGEGWLDGVAARIFGDNARWVYRLAA